MTEKELVIRAKSGDENAFEEIVKMYQQRICSTIYFMIKNNDLVEDVAQEVFIKVFRNISKFNEESSLYTWIYRITMNACIDEIKKEKKNIHFSNIIEDDESEKEVEYEDKSQNVDEIVEKKLEREDLIKAIKSLNSEQRALIVLRDIRGFSYWEISEMLMIKLGTVKSRINRARSNLKKILELQGFSVNYSNDGDS